MVIEPAGSDIPHLPAGPHCLEKDEVTSLNEAFHREGKGNYYQQGVDQYVNGQCQAFLPFLAIFFRIVQGENQAPCATGQCHRQ